MSRELWATYSVRDHLRSRAFVADAMLYDRLVVPVPPADDWNRWRDRGWKPELQAKLIEALGPIVKAVPWDEEHRNGWQQLMEKAEQDAVRIPDYAFSATGSELLMRDIPAYVTGVSAVGVSYKSIQELELDLNLQPTKRGRELPGGAVAGVVGRRFFMLDDDRLDDAQLLKETVSIVTDSGFRDKRQALHDFEEEFIRDGATDRESLQHLLARLDEFVHDEHKAIASANIKTAARCAFRVAAIGARVGGAAVLQSAGAADPLSLGALDAFLSVSEFTVDERWARDPGPQAPSPVALLHDVRRRFGWEDAARNSIRDRLRRLIRWGT